MESNKRAYLLVVKSWHTPAMNAWKWFADTMSLVDTGVVRVYMAIDGDQQWKRTIMTTSVEGETKIKVILQGPESKFKDKVLLTQATSALMAELFQIYQGFTRGSIEKNKEVAYLLRSMELSVSWEECHGEGT
jgi:hypothetical protein